MISNSSQARSSGEQIDTPLHHSTPPHQTEPGLRECRWRGVHRWEVRWTGRSTAAMMTTSCSMGSASPCPHSARAAHSRQQAQASSVPSCALCLRERSAPCCQSASCSDGSRGQPLQARARRLSVFLMNNAHRTACAASRSADRHVTKLGPRGAITTCRHGQPVCVECGDRG